MSTSVLMRRLDQEGKKILKRAATTPLDEYSQSVERDRDCLIAEQPVRTLPLAMTGLLSLKLRDEGNALLEETRVINNCHIGRTLRSMRALPFVDMEIVDLRARALDWTERATRELVYRQRRQIERDSLRTYIKLYDSIECHIGNVIVNGPDCLYALVWLAAIDCMAYLLFEACFLVSGQLEITYSGDGRHEASYSTVFAGTRERKFLDEQISYCGIQAPQYMKVVVLQPLVEALACSEPRELEDLRKEMHGSLGNLLEAFPYLVASTRATRYMFAIPGTSCVATFTFLARHGFATFLVFDSREDLVRGVETHGCRGGLTIDFDGKFGVLRHPWMTLERILGNESALRVAHWFLSQVHEQVIRDYLKINRYFMDGAAPPVADRDAPLATFGEHLGDYTEWVCEAQEVVDGAEVDQRGATDLHVASRPRVPQVRRSRFFRILEACGVKITQGKGSELKLLRDGARPFRIGNHYGPNPTIPALLAAQILKRLRISHDDWQAAVATTRC